MVYEDKHPKHNPILGLFLRLFVKRKVVNEVHYSQNSPTGPQFIIKAPKDFDTEKKRLIQFIKRAEQDGEIFFQNRESNSFGRLSSVEWNNMFYKHLDHHLRQFGNN